MIVEINILGSQIVIHGAKVTLRGDTITVEANNAESHSPLFTPPELSVEEFKSEVDGFMSKHDMAPTVFGKKFASDPGFVFGLREGREPREKTRAKVIERMRGFSVDAEAAE